KKNPPTSPKPKKKPKTTTSRARKKPKNLVDRKKPKVTSKVNATQYGITSNTSKAETERILLAELVKWHNAENSSDLERREEARKHTRNLAILRGELL
ncbi:MAG: hypothetical protein PSN35_07240, partial [Candidatus Thioglobus sp.]|uniref:hypothetical protein n=1 Tax=Candidatus Thioglobus sp. TaxID=2026721 RepID=UPI002604540E